MNNNMESPVNSNKPKKSNTLLGAVFFLLLVFIILLIAFTVYLKSAGYNFSSLRLQDAIEFVKKNKAASAAGNFEISFTQDGSVDCRLYGDYIVLVSKDGIKWYGQNSKLIQESAMTLTQPVLRFSDKYMVIADISGRDLLLYKGETLLWSRKLDNSIINADISNEGYCTVVTQSKEYKSVVQVIDLHGADKYIKNFAEDIVLSGKSIHGGQDVLINKVITDSVKAGTEFEFNNIYDEKPFSTVKVADSLFPVTISYGENEAAFGNTLIVFMDKQGKEVWRREAASLYCVAPNSSKYIIAAGKFTDDKGDTNPCVLVLNQKGKETARFDQPENIAGMDVHGDRLLLRTQKSIYIYTLKGKKLGQYSARNEIKDAYLTGSDEAIIISGSTISKVSIKE